MRKKLENLQIYRDYTGVGNGTPLQYSCLENSMDRRAWQATVHEVAKNQTQLSIQLVCTRFN